MGFDVSFHPTNVPFIQQRLCAYIMSGDGIDDLLTEAVRLGKVRFRANAWSIGLMKGRQSGLNVPGFDTDLHAWGRPFLCTGHSPQEVSMQIEQYLNSSPADADAIAMEMLNRLVPDLPAHIQPEGNNLPPDDAIIHDYRWKLDLLRECWVAIQIGKTVVNGPNGEQLEPRETLVTSAALEILTFASHFQPGWMARGYVWPTHLLSQVAAPGLFARLIKLEPGPGHLFQPATPLVEPMLQALPELKDALLPTIEQNYSVGGFVSVEHVPAMRAWFEGNVERLITHAKKENWEAECRLAVQKIVEALTDAELRSLSFCEASEVYSAPLGIMN